MPCSVSHGSARIIPHSVPPRHPFLPPFPSFPALPFPLTTLFVSGIRIRGEKEFLHREGKQQGSGIKRLMVSASPSPLPCRHFLFLSLSFLPFSFSVVPLTEWTQAKLSKIGKEAGSEEGGKEGEVAPSITHAIIEEYDDGYFLFLSLSFINSQSSSSLPYKDLFFPSFSFRPFLSLPPFLPLTFRFLPFLSSSLLPHSLPDVSTTPRVNVERKS